MTVLAEQYSQGYYSTDRNLSLEKEYKICQLLMIAVSKHCARDVCLAYDWRVYRAALQSMFRSSEQMLEDDQVLAFCSLQAVAMFPRK